VRPPRKKPSFPIASRDDGREQTGFVRCFLMVGCRAAGLLCDFSLVSVSSPHSIQRADPMLQVDYVLVVEWDIRASKTDNLFCPSPQGAVCCRTGWFGSGFDSLPATLSHYLRRQTTMFGDFPRSRRSVLAQECSFRPRLGATASLNERLWNLPTATMSDLPRPPR
jgi:hypothetical protein